MRKSKRPANENRDNNHRREAFERNGEQVISGLEDVEARTSREFGEALVAINDSLSAMAYSFLWREANYARRRDWPALIFCTRCYEGWVR
jgi:hypothetical protein